MHPLRRNPCRSGSQEDGVLGVSLKGCPSSCFLSEPGHRAALHQAHDCHHPRSEV